MNITWRAEPSLGNLLTTYRHVWSNFKTEVSSSWTSRQIGSLKWSQLNETRVQWKSHCLSTLLACAKTLQPFSDSQRHMSLLYAHFTGHLSAFSKLSPQCLLMTSCVLTRPGHWSGGGDLQENGWVWGHPFSGWGRNNMSICRRIGGFGGIPSQNGGEITCLSSGEWVSLGASLLSMLWDKAAAWGHRKHFSAWSGDKQFLVGERRWLRKDRSRERRKGLCLDRMNSFLLQLYAETEKREEGCVL